jgi:hypothetical protein
MRTLMHALLVSCLVACCAPSLVRAADEPAVETKPKKVWQQLKPERLVSDASILYVSTPDFKRARTAFERTALFGLINESDVYVPLMQAVAAMKDSFVRGDGSKSTVEINRRSQEIELLTKIAPLFDGQVAIAIEKSEADAVSRMPRFIVVASMPNGDAGEELQHKLESILDRYRFGQSPDEQYSDSSSHIGAYDVYHMTNPEINLVESWAFVENLFVYGQGKKIVEDAVERFSMKSGAGTLAIHEGFQSAYKQVGRDEKSQDSLVYLQVNVSPLMANHAAAEAVSNKALNYVQGPQVALGVQVSDGENSAIKEKIAFRLAKGAIPVKATDPCKAFTARFAQFDTLHYSAMQVNFLEFYKATMDFYKGYCNATKIDPVLEQQVRTLLGVQNEAEVLSKLESFKGEMAIFFNYVAQPRAKLDSLKDLTNSFQPVVAIELDRDNFNERAFDDIMLKMEQATKQTYLSSPAGGTTIRYQKGAAPREDKSGKDALGLFANLGRALRDTGITPFFTCYAKVEMVTEAAGTRRFLLLADNLDALRKAVNQVKLPKSSLAESKKFRTLMNNFRDDRYDMNYFDLPQMVRISSGLLPSLPRNGFLSRDTLNNLPPASVLEPHLFAMGWSGTVLSKYEGVMYETYSPSGAIPMFTLMGLTAYPSIASAQAAEVSARTGNNFKRISLALHLYASDNDRYPQQVSELITNGYIDKKDLTVFESPFKRGKLAETTDVDNPDLSNLIYVPQHALNDMGKTVLLYEKEPTKLITTRDNQAVLMHHVITIDGREKYMTRSKLDRLLAGKADASPVTAETKIEPKKGK